MGCSSSKEFEKSVSVNGHHAPFMAQSSSREFDGMKLDRNAAVAQRSIVKRQTAKSVAQGLLEANEGQRFHDHYIRPTLVSYGASCKVLTAYHKRTDAKVAVKTIPKNTRNPETQRTSVLNEIGILKEVEDHPNAVKLLEVYEEAHSYYIVMDCCDGGELFEHITKDKDGFTERHAAQILRSLMLFLAHMHSKGMAHMDIKPENIMFDSEGAQGVVKVIDFGSSIYIQPEETVRDAFGTVRYSSPEMAADDGIGQKTDVWSAGVVMFFMLCGSAPFLKKHEVDTLNYIKNKPKVKFSGYRWAAISQQAKDCISAMLEVEPSRRPTAQQVLQMPWLRTQVSGPETCIRSDILSHLRTFANQNRMRRLLLGLMAAKITGTEANRLLNQFYTMDSDFSGTIELQELAKVAKQALPDLADTEVENLFHALDLNSTGTVDVKEFFASLLQTMAPENQVAVARKSFVHLDREHSGFVTKKAFVDAMVEQAIASGMDHEDTALLVDELEAEFMALDVNSDGQLSFDEFKSVLGLGEQAAAGAKAVARQGSVTRTNAATAAVAVATATPEARQSTRPLTPEAAAQGATVVRVALMLQEQARRTTSTGINTEGRMLSRTSSRASGGGNTSPAMSGRQQAPPLEPADAAPAQPALSPAGASNSQLNKQAGQNKNPASAAAAIAAAVAATVAASTPDDSEMTTRMHRDANWPKDPGMATPTPGHTRVRSRASEPEDDIAESNPVARQLQQSWFGVPHPEHTRASASGRSPGEQQHAHSKDHSCRVLGSSREPSSVPGLNPIFGRSSSARASAEAQGSPAPQSSSQRQGGAPMTKQLSLPHSDSSSNVKELASGAANLLSSSGKGGCLEAVRSMSGRPASGKGVLGLRKDIVA